MIYDVYIPWTRTQQLKGKKKKNTAGNNLDEPQANYAK